MRVWPLCVAVALLGCAQTVKEVARQSSRAAVDESVDQLTDDESKQQLADAMEDPRIERAMLALTDHVSEGILKSLESERAHEQLAALTANATRVAAQQMIAAMQSPKTQAQLEGLATSLTQTVLTSVGHTLTSDFMPALRTALEQDLARGAAASMTGPLHQALGATAQNVAYNAVLGVNEGLRSSWTGNTGAASDLRGFAQAGVPWLRLIVWGLGLSALALLCAATIAIARAQRARAEVRRLESATLLLATAMSQAHASPETDEIVAVVRTALERRAPHSGLFRFLQPREPKTS